MIHRERLKRAEPSNGCAATVGILIGIGIGMLIEAVTGCGIAHQICQGIPVDGHAACRTPFLPFCF